MLKKTISTLLAAALLLSCVPFALAADTAKAGAEAPLLPVVIIRGMDFNRIYTHYGETDQTPLFRGVTAGGILKTLFAALKNAKTEGFNHALAGAAIAYAGEILGDMACDENGESVLPVGYAGYDCSVAESPELQLLLQTSESKEEALVRVAAETLGPENVYFFTYDYRLDPYAQADRLKAFIDMAAGAHGTEQVDLINCSMGGVITDCYLYKYGAGRLRKCVFLSSTFCGTNVATEVLCGEVQTDEGMLYRYIKQLTGSGLLAGALKATGLLKLAAKWFNGFVESEGDYVYGDFLSRTFGTMLSFWANVQPDRVDDALERIFPTQADRTKYAGLIEKIRRLQTVMAQREEMLRALPGQGVEVAVVAGYDSAPIPLYPSAAEQTDSILDSRWMLGCAEVSKLGERLDAEGEYVSPDGCVDLTDALFPDCTWAIRGAGHVPAVYGSDCARFLMALLRYDGQPDRNSFEEFPQFFAVDPKTKNILSDRSPVC